MDSVDQYHSSLEARDGGPEHVRSSAAQSRGEAPLVVHLIYRLDVGGLENGLVNLINWMPADRCWSRSPI